MLKLTCDQAQTAEALAHLASVASTRSPNPIVLNVRIAAADGRVTFYATDFERSLRFTIEGVQVDSPGEICLPAKRLSDSVRVLDKTVPLVINETKEGAEVISGRTRFAIRGQDPADFPAFPEFNDAEAFELPAKDLAYMIDMVRFAIAPERTRYSLNGVLFEVRKDELTLVGSDGKRLAMLSHAYHIGKDYQAHIIAPRAGLELVSWICGGADTVWLQIQENQMLARTQHAVVSTQLVAGLYPAFRQVLPDEAKLDKKAVIKRDSFATHLRRAQQFTSDESRSVRFAFGSNRLTMTSRSPDEGEAEVEMDIEYVAPELEVGFDPQFVSDVLKVLETDDVVLNMKDPDSAGIIRQDKDGFRYLYLVMPTELG
ncbi:MAG: DNA polymerase III subunit beta [Planctomycetota bacterium]